jgi:predicted ATPase/class 3 adenylate cyclase
VLPNSASARQVGDQVRSDFAVNSTTNVTVVIPDITGVTPDELNRYAAQLSQVPHVSSVSAPGGTFVGGSVVGPASAPTAITDGSAFFTVGSTAPLFSPASETQLDRLHAVAGPGGRRVQMTGTAQINRDGTEAITSRLPTVLGVIAGITFVLLFLLTGSVVLPLKALLLNALALTATFGALVWIFQDGHLGAFGTTATGTLNATVPVLLFCIAFGLSMDYEVFLVSRIREYWLTSGRPSTDNDESVALGVARTGRVVTAAAVVMSISFAALIAAQVSFMRMFGVGLTLAVLVDATLVRIVLVPAFMHVLGRVNWWAPKPLARLHARFGISEASTPEPTEAAMKKSGQRVDTGGRHRRGDRGVQRIDRPADAGPAGSDQHAAGGVHEPYRNGADRQGRQPDRCVVPGQGVGAGARCSLASANAAGTALVNWSDLGVSELLPTGTVTLLLADVEGSTRLWQTQSEEMTAAVVRLDRAVCDIVAAHGGVRPVEQGEGDSFVVAFARASDAAACALELQRAPFAPIRLRIGVHTGETQLRDEGNYIGPTVNRTAHLRDLAHGGQTVLSGATEGMVVDCLPAGAWLIDLGTHPLRDLPRPERVVQLCHPDLRNDFPPLRTAKAVVSHNLPMQLTSFVGRAAQMTDVEKLLVDNRLVTLTGAGGAGKTRLAVEIAARIAPEFRYGVWYVDLAPVTHPGVVPVAVGRALGLPDQPGRSTMDTLLRFVRDRQMLVVLDNCEHLLDASAELVVALLGAAPGLTVLATSREPIGVAGEVSWRAPSLSLADEAIELFIDRAHRARPDFRLTDDNTKTVTEICRRLDGVPLAIELAAARVRALSLAEILDGLHDRFRLLTGGARTAVRRQQTLRASVDWSYALLTEPERVLFRRLAVFLGAFDLEAAQAVAGGADRPRFQVLDMVTLLVDKSLVVADNSGGATRYRLLETVRQYALEKLGESGEADAVRSRHRDYYTAMAAVLDAPAGRDYEGRVEQAETEVDNLRAAFLWSRENCDIELALALASSLQPLWLSQGRIREGRAWFDAALADLDAQRPEVAPAVRARALLYNAVLNAWGGNDGQDQAQQALVIARQVDDPALLAPALTARGLAPPSSALNWPGRTSPRRSALPVPWTIVGA